MKESVMWLLKWFIIIFILPIHAVFLFTAIACSYIADGIEECCVSLCGLICDVIEKIEKLYK